MQLLMTTVPHKNFFTAINNLLLGSFDLVIPAYPTADDVIIDSMWNHGQMNLFINFYRSYNRQMLSLINNLDFEQTFVS